MKIYILGVAGTFMASFALLARKLGHEVSGCDKNIYPPMSDQLKEQKIRVDIGYSEENVMNSNADIFVIGNAVSRSNPALEWVLNNGKKYTSAPEFMKEHILSKKHTIAVSGTHGKTTTSSMIAWILEYCDLNPSFLIGGMPKNFETSSRLTDGKYFVIEADEYDTAFFDKRSKFIHYLPNTLVINNIEFDHADIFENLKAIKKQFHHLVRTIASKDCIVFCNQKNVNQVLDMGTYSNKFSFGKSPSDDMQIYKSTLANKTTQKFKIKQKEKNYTVLLPMLGDHNKFNSVAAISACLQIGVSIDKSISALALFEGAKRRQEVFLNKNNIEFIEDFAHHPTAIKQTALAFKKTLQQDAKLIAVIDPRSNTMKKGILKNSLLKSISIPDLTILYQHKDLPWKYDNLPKNIILANSIEKIISLIKENAKPNDIVVTMSNGSFDGIKNKIIQSYK